MKIKRIPTEILFVICFLISSSGWILVPQQVKEIPETVAVSIRFTIGFLFLVWWDYIVNGALFRRRDLKTTLLLIANGFCSFFFNYYLCYLAAFYIPSGIIVVILSTIILPNILLERVFLAKPITIFMLMGGLSGCAGIGLLSLQDLSTFQFLSVNEIKGMLLAFSSTFFSAVGYLLSKKLSEQGFSSLSLCKYSMGYASLMGVSLCLFNNAYIDYSDNIFSNLPGLLYIGVVVTAIVFVLFMEIINRVGPAKASYLWSVTPVGALCLSYFFEGYRFTTASISGIIVVLLGGLFVKTVPQLFQKELIKHDAISDVK